MSRRRSPRDNTNRTAPDQSHGTRAPDSTPQSIGSACPDDDYIEQLWAEAQASGHPVSRRYIRQRLASAQTDWDTGGPVLTYVTRRGEISRSVPADPIGERVASRLAGAA